MSAESPVMTRTLLDGLFRTSALTNILSDRASVTQMLRFEASLARAGAEAGLFPAAAAAQIAACCDVERVDFDALREGVAKAGNLAIPLVKQLTEQVRAVAPEAAGFVHWGATSQDVQDSGLVLQILAALAWFENELERLCEVLAQLSEQHQATLMAGRTWMQHAVPVTFGLKMAGCLDAMHRYRTRLQELKVRVQVLQFGGAAGTLAALGERGLEVQHALAAELDLASPDVPWHSHRDRLVEVVGWAGMLTGTLGKMARDLALGMQTELAEFAEPAAPEKGGSSTMPHKRNPVLAAVVLSAATRVPGLVATMLTAMVQENERGLGGWHAEWETLPEVLVLAGGALEAMVTMLQGLEIYPDAMRRNSERTRGLLLAEAVAMALAPHVGRDRAHHLVAEAATKALAHGSDLEKVLAADVTVTNTLSRAELHSLFEPVQYLGVTSRMIASVLKTYADTKKVED